MSAGALAYTCLHLDKSVKLRGLLALALSLIGSVFLVVSEPLAAEASSTPGSGFLRSQDYYVDPSGSANFATIRGADFKPFEGTLSKGYISGAVWLRLRVAATPRDQSLVIIVEPPFLQSLELYDPTQRGFSADAPVVSGRDTRSAIGSFDGIDNGFVVPGSGTEREFFIRVVSTTSILVDVSILTQEQARNANTSNIVIIGIYVALLMMFVIWGCISLIITREGIYGYFVLRQLSSLAHAFVFFGFIRIFFAGALSLSSREIIYAVVIVTSFTFSGLFDFKIIAQHRPSKLLHSIFGAILCFPVVSIALIALGQVRDALHLNTLALNVCLATLFLLAMSVRGFTDNPLERLAVWVIRIGYLITTITVLLPVLMYQNVLPGHAPLIKLIFIHAVVSSIVMLTLLTIQNRQRDLSFQEAMLEVAVKDVELQIENRKREDKERFLSMITHELRNPLTVVRLLTDRSSERGQSMYEAVMDMAKVIERVEQSEKLSSGKWVIERRPVDILHVTRDLLGERQAVNRWELSGPSKYVVETDEHLFRVVMTNLIDNAEHYSPEGSLLCVKVGTAEGDQTGLVVEVSNRVNEFCIPDQTRIFERYYRSKGAHRTPGSGLGLFLVKGWVEALGGSINCCLSGKDRGEQVFKMTIRLP